MDRIIQSPGKYIQGADVINRLGEYLKPLAERWLVVGDKFVLGFAQSTVEKSFKDAGLVVEIAPFGGECSQNEMMSAWHRGDCAVWRNSRYRWRKNPRYCQSTGTFHGCSGSDCTDYRLYRCTVQRIVCYLHR